MPRLYRPQKKPLGFKSPFLIMEDSLPGFPKPIASISVGLDSTCLNMKEYDWQEAIYGTLALFDKEGERMHTIYTAASPKYGKENFLNELDNEVTKIIHLYPGTPIIGLADGASCNGIFL